MLAISVAAVLGFAAVDVSAQAGSSAQQWISLGPSSGVTFISQIGVPPDWPTDPFVYVVVNGPPGAHEVLGTFDGGGTWRHLARLPDVPRWLRVGPGRVLFAATCNDQGPPCRLVHSADAGQSWQTALDLGRSAFSASLELSRVGIIFAVANERLHRSSDAGQTWDLLDPSPGRHVQQIALSPALAGDRTIFATATVGNFEDRADPDERTNFEAALLGDADVLVSHDAGATWTSSSAGLELDALPYRHVQELVISPSFAQAGTLFVFAWGTGTPPQVDRSRSNAPRTVLFRSRDRGTSWRYVWEPASDSALSSDMQSRGVWPRYRASLVLSPDAAAHGSGILALNWWAGGRSTVCKIYRSSDSGRTWDSIMPAWTGGYRLERCGRPLMGGPDGLTAVWSATYDHFDRTATSWIRTTDVGVTTDVLMPPMQTGDTFYSHVPPMVLTSDGTIFAGTESI
jgi:hypothetical protein